MNKYYSQHGEDALLDLIFKDQEEGFFIEVGCIDGRCFSNTLGFEERGWKGMCVEAHAGYIDLLKKNRPNSIICHYAAGEADEDAIFYANARGSLSTLDKASEARWQRDYAPFFSGFEEQNVKKVRLSTLLDNCQISEIDILSLDIEGYEVEAMKGLDLSRHRPKVMVIESDSPHHEAQLDELILPHGYMKTMKLCGNIFYVRDKEIDDALKDRQCRIFLTHTRHPLDEGGDWTEELMINTSSKAQSIAPAEAQSLFARLKSGLFSFFHEHAPEALATHSERQLSQFIDVGFHGDKYLLGLAGQLAAKSKVFVETGSNVGSTLAYVAKNNPQIRCLSCEPDPAAFAEANKHAGKYGNVSLFRGTSQQFINYLSERGAEIFTEPSFFWLDAHSYGFEWPLKAELEFITQNFKSGFILIDDFKVPGRDHFGYDQYGEQICSFDYVKGALNSKFQYQLYYPTYDDRTSRHHPLRGWGLIIFGCDDFRIPDQIAGKMERAM